MSQIDPEPTSRAMSATYGDQEAAAYNGHLRWSFVENGVDLRALPHPSEDDLKELGVLLGHRRILLAAIASLQDQERARQGEEPASEPLSRGEADRRQLTVMFCDLVGSTELSGRLDPEDLRDVMRSYQDVVTDAVAHYGGHVAKYLGDGLLVYFGWPQAYEDQAERAVRAGLEAVEAVASDTASSLATIRPDGLSSPDR